METNVNALAQAVNAQASMGMLITKILGQSAEMIQQQLSSSAQQEQQKVVASAIEGLGESLDVVA